jgi:hypothetical protein
LDDRSVRALWRQLVHDRWLVALNLKGNAVGPGGQHLLHASFMADAVTRLEGAAGHAADPSSPGPRPKAAKQQAGSASQRTSRRLAAAKAARRHDAREAEALNLAGLLLDGQAGAGEPSAGGGSWLGPGPSADASAVGSGGDPLRAAVANFRAHAARAREDAASHAFQQASVGGGGGGEIVPGGAVDEFAALAEAAVGGGAAVAGFAQGDATADHGLLSPVAALAADALLGNALKVRQTLHASSWAAKKYA